MRLVAITHFLHSGYVLLHLCKCLAYNAKSEKHVNITVIPCKQE